MSSECIHGKHHLNDCVHSVDVPSVRASEGVADLQKVRTDFVARAVRNICVASKSE